MTCKLEMCLVDNLSTKKCNGSYIIYWEKGKEKEKKRKFHKRFRKDSRL